MDVSIKSKIYYPMLVSGSGTAEPLTKEEDILIWRKYRALPQSNRDIITSYELPRKLKELQTKYSLNELVIGKISFCIRRCFFQEIDINTLLSEVTNLLMQSGSDASKASEIVSFIDKEIFHLVPQVVIENGEETSEKVSEIKKIPLLKALVEYPRLNDQLITQEKIRVKGQPELVRPSLANWIRYYRDELGIGFHDQVTRGKFLFQSENGKKLSNDERERINLILKSLEEEFPLDISTESGVIVFPVRSQSGPAAGAFLTPRTPFQESRPTKPFQSAAPSHQSTAPLLGGKSPFFTNLFGAAKNIAGDTLHFSTGHVLPSEKEVREEKAVPQHPDPLVVPAPSVSLPRTDFDRGGNGISQSRGAVLPRSPYSIRPLRMRQDADRESEVR